MRDYWQIALSWDVETCGDHAKCSCWVKWLSIGWGKASGRHHWEVNLGQLAHLERQKILVV